MDPFYPINFAHCYSNKFKIEQIDQLGFGIFLLDIDITFLLFFFRLCSFCYFFHSIYLPNKSISSTYIKKIFHCIFFLFFFFFFSFFHIILLCVNHDHVITLNKPDDVTTTTKIIIFNVNEIYVYLDANKLINNNNNNNQACGKYMPATAATVQSNQIGTGGLQEGTYLVEESF